MTLRNHTTPEGQHPSLLRLGALAFACFAIGYATAIYDVASYLNKLFPERALW